MSDLFLLLSMPAIAACVGRDAPQVRLDVVHLSPVQTAAALETDEIDIALSTGLAVPSTIDHTVLFRDELVCLVRRDHPQADAQLDMATFLNIHHVKIAHGG